MKYVLISGASGGMGKQTVSYLLKQGYYVFALDNKEIEKLKKQGVFLIAELTVEKDGSISEINIFQSDAIEINKDKHVKDIMRIFEDNNPNSPWRQMTLETSRYKYAWVSTNEKANNAVRSYIKGLKWSFGKLYELPTRTCMYYILP